MLSNYDKKISKKQNISNYEIKKLILNITRKKYFVCYWQLYLLHQIKLGKIHRRLKCKQTWWTPCLSTTEMLGAA